MFRVNCPFLLQRSFLIFFFSLFPFTLFSQVIKSSQQTGNWEEILWVPIGTPTASEDVLIDHTVTIPEGTAAEVNNLHIGSNGKLIVNGSLKVNGNITMDNNYPEFSMGPDAIVVVNGDFLASNKMDISISSFLIIQGDFSKSGSANQGDLDVNEGSIYIFGEVAGWGAEFTGCPGSYEGSTSTEEVATCDYGSYTDFVNNEIPDEVIAISSCFNLSNISDQSVCELSKATFQIDPLSDVNYQWQIKIPNQSWTDIANATNYFYEIVNTPLSKSGNKYRVLVTPDTNYFGNCKMTISRSAHLEVIPTDYTLGNISGASNICSGSQNITYSIPAIPNPANYEWIVPNGWNITNGQGTTDILVNIGTNPGTFPLQIISINTCGVEKSTVLNITVSNSGLWSGTQDSNWNSSANWNCNRIPDINTNVIINSGLTNYPVLNSGANGTANNISVQTGASLTIVDKTLEIAGTIYNNGTLDATSGTVSFIGAVNQDVQANTFANNRIKNLTINNPSNVNLQGDLEVTGIVKVIAGNLNSGGFLSLISDNSQTALIDGSGNGEILGSVTMQRYIGPAFGYKYLSTPFSNTVVGDYQSYVDFTSNFPNFYQYVEDRNNGPNRDASGWEAYTTLTASVNPLLGYALNFGSGATPITINISGIVNNGNQQISLNNTNGTYTQGFNLVGNPYPSPIDWEAPSGWNNSNIDNALYFFSASSTDPYTGTYSSYVNGIPSNDGKSSNIIPSMQGFFVHVTDPISTIYPVNANLEMTNEVRVNNFSQEFIKSQEISEASLLRFSASLGKNNAKDYLVLYFNEHATPNFENDMDALKLMNTAPQVPNFYNLSANKKLSINALRFPGEEPEIIPLGISTKKEDWVNIKLENQQNLPPELYVYLIDSKKKIGINLREKQEYRFYKNQDIEDNRFSILLSNSPVSNPAVAFNEHFNITTIGEDVIIRMNLEKGENGVLQVNTITGQNIESLNVTGKNEYTLKGINSSGIYLFSLNLDDELFTRKIIIKK